MLNLTEAILPSRRDDATCAKRSAPAVCEEEGPTIIGPRISKAEVETEDNE